MNIAKKKKWFLLNSGGGAQAYDSPYPLRVASLNTTSVSAWLVKNAADSYNWYLYDATGTTLLQSDLASSSSSKVFSGLTIGTTYTVKVSGNKTGYDTSPELVATVTTRSFVPLVEYQMIGLDRDTDNIYGTVNSLNSISAIKSLGSDTESLVTTGAGLGFLPYYASKLAYVYVNASAGGLVKPTPIVLSGAFTIAFRAIAVSSATAQIFNYTSNANHWLRWNSLAVDRFYINMGGVGVLLIFTSPLVAGNQYNFVVQKDGSNNYKVSTDGGVTYSTPVSGTSNGITLDRFSPGNGFFQKILIDNTVLTIDKLSEFFNNTKQAIFSSPAQISNITVKGLTWVSRSGDYLIDTTYDYNVLASYIRDRIVVRGKYAFILGNLSMTAPYYAEDFVRVWNLDTDEISPNKLLGINRSINNETHNSGSLFDHGNTMKHLEMSSHYDSNTTQPTTLVIKEFGANYNLAEYTQQILANGAASVVNSTTQYMMGHKMVNSVGLTFCGWAAISGGQRYFLVNISDDNMNSWTRYPVLDVGVNYWVYYTSVYAEDGKLRTFFNVINKAGGGRDGFYDYLCYAESSDGYTWTNRSGSYSKDVRNGNMSLSDITTNFLVQDASALLGDARIAWAFLEPASGDIFGMIGDGNNTGLKHLKLQSDGTVNMYPFSADGQILNYNFSIGNGDNAPIIVWRGGTTFDAYVHGENGGLWTILRYRSTDGGVNYTYQEKISTDDTALHRRMAINRNTVYQTNKVLGAARKVSSTNSDIFIKNIT